MLQLSWGSAAEDRRIKELPPLNTYAEWLVNNIIDFGLNNDAFSWVELTAFEESTGIVFNPSEKLIIRRLLTAFRNGLSLYREDDSAPPFMSQKMTERRARAIKQVKELGG